MMWFETIIFYAAESDEFILLEGDVEVNFWNGKFNKMCDFAF